LDLHTEVREEDRVAKAVKCAMYTKTAEKHGQKIQNKTDSEKRIYETK
jgi:hypothetical protein